MSEVDPLFSFSLFVVPTLRVLDGIEWYLYYGRQQCTDGGAGGLWLQYKSFTQLNLSEVVLTLA